MMESPFTDPVERAADIAYRSTLKIAENYSRTLLTNWRFNLHWTNGIKLNEVEEARRLATIDAINDLLAG